MDASPPAVLISGKRRSGKDFTVDALVTRLQQDGIAVHVLRISEPIKLGYAKEHGLDFDTLMTVSELREQHRAQMIQWGIDRRDKDTHIFCREVAGTPEAQQASLWILSDARRPSDLQYFIDRCGRQRVLVVRILASEDVRRARGWKFMPGVDDADSECALNGWTDYDFRMENNEPEAFQTQFARLYSAIVQLLKHS